MAVSPLRVKCRDGNAGPTGGNLRDMPHNNNDRPPAPLVLSTGVMMQVDNIDRIPQWDDSDPQHLWIWLAAYRAGVTAETPMLDGETLLIVQGPMCYHCDLSYTPRVAAQKCAGE